MEIISKSHNILSNNSTTTISLLESAQNSTKDLTTFYAWANKSGNIQWSTLFSENKKIYDRYIDANISSHELFKDVKSTPEFSFISSNTSLLNIPTIIVAYPILKDNNNIQKISQSNSTENLFDVVNTQQQEERSNSKFYGIVYAEINTTSIIKILETQILLNNRSSISLLDRGGSILYSANKSMDNVILNSEKNKDFIANNFDQENQQLIYGIKDKILSSSETKSVDIKDKFDNLSSTITYAPIHIKDDLVYYLIVNTPHVFAQEIDNFIVEQQKFATGSTILIGLITILTILIINRVNIRLKKIIEDKTRELKRTIDSLIGLNEQLIQSEKMQRDFVNLAAHELRTPVQAIVGYIEMIKGFPEELKKYLKPLERNSNRLYRLTDNILDIARIENNNLKLNKEKFDILQLVKDTINDYSHESRNTRKNNFKIMYKNELGTSDLTENEKIFIYADKIRIQQVISNLIHNAYTFTENGLITITIEKLKSNTDKEFILVKVKDTGQGVDSEILPKLFEKFVTKSDIGTGLGLYITKKIIEAHGGKIWLNTEEDNSNSNNTSEKNKGAEFDFTLPI